MSRMTAIQQHVRSASRRDEEMRRAQLASDRAHYFERSEVSARHHEQWTTEDYYERANLQAQQLAQKKKKDSKLAERRQKLEALLFKENLEYQAEMKALSAQPKLYRNGSYLNDVPTSTLREINQGIKDKEEELRKKEAELRLYHMWRANQPILREAESRYRNGALKTAWMEQLVEKEVAKNKEEEETRKCLEERDRQIQAELEEEQEQFKAKEEEMKKLRQYLQNQISELSQSETEVKQLRQQEERETLILEELRHLVSERKKVLERLASERETCLVNMGLHRHRLKCKVAGVLREIEADLDMLQQLHNAAVKDFMKEQEHIEHNRRTLDEVRARLQAQRDLERQRQRQIDAMFDGEARQMAEKQDKLWQREREARHLLLEEVVATLKQQVEARVEANRHQQKQNVLERERLLEDIEEQNRRVEQSEKEKEMQKSKYGRMAQLQLELNKLRVQEAELDAAKQRQEAARQLVQDDERVRQELLRLHRRGTGELAPQITPPATAMPPTRAKSAW